MTRRASFCAGLRNAGQVAGGEESRFAPTIKALAGQDDSMNNEFLPLSDWLQQDSAAPASCGGTTQADSAPFSDALARLFNAAFEAGAPPAYLRAMLAVETWLPMTLPEPSACAAAAARTRAYSTSIDGHAASSRKKNKHAMPIVTASARNTVAYQVVSPDIAAASHADGLSALQVLQQLPDVIGAVVLRFGEDLYSFNRDQCRALRAHFQSIADRRIAAGQEQRDLFLLAGQGSLEEFLAMTVRAQSLLKADCTAHGEVLDLQTLGFRASRSDSITLPLRELVQRIATRQDLDGVQFNRPYSGTPAFEFGPNFAAYCLRGEDPRHAGGCPARAIREIEFGVYLTRRFALVDAQRRAMISQRLDLARALLGAIEPGQTALTRGAVISLEGARALRKFPQVAQRQWLTDFIARAERALAARWRIGVF